MSWVTAHILSGTRAHVLRLQNAPDFSLEELKETIASSQKAFESWRHSTPTARSAVLQKWKQHCIENEADLALLITVENGKPLHESKGEVSSGGIR